MRLLLLLLLTGTLAIGQMVQESFAVDPGPLDFIQGDGQEQIILQMLTGDALTGLNTAGEPVPRLAERWQRRKDGWLFTLRSDARFADGNPVTPEDVVWTFREIQTHPNASMSKRCYLADLSVAGSKEGVYLKTRKPLARLLRELARIPIARRAHPNMGSGPFALEKRQDEWHLSARTHFLSPRIPGFRFRLIPDSQGILHNLQKGWLSLGTRPPRSNLKPCVGYREIRQATHAQLILFSRLGPGPLKSFETWRRDAIPEGFLGPQAKSSRGLWPESLGFPPTPMHWDKPGAVPPKKLEVSYAAGDELVQRLLLAYRKRAQKDGVEVLPQPVEPGLLGARLERGEFGLACALNLFEPHPWSVLDYLEPSGALNFCHWRHPDYEQLQNQLEGPDSPAWARLQELWAKQPGALPLLDFSSVIWVDQRLEVAPSPLGLYMTTPGPSGWYWRP